MRPVTRRWEPNDLDAARRVVSRAERQALDRAEELRKQAEDLLQASADRRADAAREAREEVASELEVLRAELEQASRRANEAEAEIETLKVGGAQPEETRRPLTLVRPKGGEPVGESPLVEFLAKLAADAERLVHAAQADGPEQLAPPRVEGEDLLTAAWAAVERDTQAAAEALEQAEQERAQARLAREAADRMVAEAKAESERLLEETRQTREAQLASVRTEFASEMGSLREALDVVRTTLDRILGGGSDRSDSIDLRQLSELVRGRP